MSSAILYLAIIAIWAGVLIPRWLRRDSARSHLTSAQVGGDEPGSSAGEGTTIVPDDTATSGDADAPDADNAADDTARAPASPGDSRRHVLAARRRLLWMMLALEAAADALAATGLAAWWVIAPPTVMLAGYLLLLREAAQADAERDARERDAAHSRELAEHARQAGKTRAAQHPPAPPEAPAVFAAAPVPGDYEDLRPGRDFTPGGRYAASGSACAPDDAYDQYTEDRLRAVGD